MRPASRRPGDLTALFGACSGDDDEAPGTAAGERVAPSSTRLTTTESAWTTALRTGTWTAGNGRFGHADLAGNVLEWTLDDYQSAFPIDPCDDCTVDLSRIFRTVRGGDYDSGMHPRAAARELGQVDARDPYVGARCARRAVTADGG